MSAHAVTVLITRRIKPGCEVDFEKFTVTMMQTAASFPGCLGAQLVHPGEDPDVTDPMYHIVLAFDRQSNLDNWHASPERKRGLAAAAPFIEGAFKTQPLSGLGLWFQTSQPSPPKWKVAVVTWLGICPTVYLLFLWMGDRLSAWPLLPRTVLLTLAVVVLMNWVVAPRLTRLFGPWMSSHRVKP